VKTNISCDDCERELAAYLDGELTEAVARVLESHIHACALCGSRLEAYRAISTRLAELPDIAVPAWLEGRVIHGATAKERARRLWRRGLAAGVAVSFAGGVGVVAILPRLAKAWGLPDPATWPLGVLNGMVGGVVSVSKGLARDAAFYSPILHQVWQAILALESVPRAALLTLRTSEAQMVGAILITLGGAIYFALRPSRTHERGIGHACLSL
jgi:anti-sigma factor RsiW